MASTPEQNYQRMLALKASQGFPGGCPIRYFQRICYLASTTTSLRHLSQINLKWKPQDAQDRRAEVPVFGLGNFTLPGSLPGFKLRCGVEAKRAINIMASLPPANSIMRSYDHISVAFLAQNQAKAAYKNKCPLSDDGIQWILLARSYWMPKSFDPFSEAESTVRAHKIIE